MRVTRFNELVELRILLEGTATEKAATTVTKWELRILKSLAERKTGWRAIEFTRVVPRFQSTVQIRGLPSRTIPGVGGSH
jgi:DNA-binding FadR family transcriptional regulator